MVGLDVTNQVLFSRSERDALSANTSREAVLVREVTRHLFDVRGVDTMALHDPLAVGVAIEPDLVTTLQQEVRVETRGELTAGQTVVDLRPNAPPPVLPTHVCTGVDAARFKALFFETLGLPFSSTAVRA